LIAPQPITTTYVCIQRRNKLRDHRVLGRAMNLRAIFWLRHIRAQIKTAPAACLNSAGGSENQFTLERRFLPAAVVRRLRHDDSLTGHAAVTLTAIGFWRYRAGTTSPPNPTGITAPSNFAPLKTPRSGWHSLPSSPRPRQKQ